MARKKSLARRRRHHAYWLWLQLWDLHVSADRLDADRHLWYGARAAWLCPLVRRVTDPLAHGPGILITITGWGFRFSFGV